MKTFYEHTNADGQLEWVTVDMLEINETVQVQNESWITKTTLIESTDGGSQRITYPDGTVVENE